MKKYNSMMKLKSEFKNEDKTRENLFKDERFREIYDFVGGVVDFAKKINQGEK